ncbi:hypothetical protein C7974DRAFT_406935 [Boeremia exigua]|uniref:uncharacterized protein n=1 Tax=Boeremia exigua TaxID=749465 RepID=UPI001E8D4760|nr:uncharacterized protein C7974DRAFT_406935 [Boeremia exigua]KAH6612060.1 hypothetical protein C7974DRAFT_406935 [Boeremia exigua]
MGSRALTTTGPRALAALLRPRTHTRILLAPTHRALSNTPSAPADARTPPTRAPQPSKTATQTIDDLFAPEPTSTNTPAAATPPRVFGSTFSPPPRTRTRPIGLAFDSMDMPSSLLSPSLANKPAASLAAAQRAAFEAYPRLEPAYGRTVELDATRGRDIVRGIGMLGSLMARNRVKRDVQSQRFHERGGLKRKRLASERWRARFRKGFQEVTGRVVELTRKGW